MSQFTPNNPYQSDSSAYAGGTYQPTMSGWTKAIFIIFIIFGAAGIMSACIGTIQMVFITQQLKMMTNAAASHEPSSKIHLVSYSQQVPTLKFTANQDQAADGLFVEEEVEEEAASETNPVPGSIHFDVGGKEILERALREPYPGAHMITIVLSIVSALISVAMLIGGILGLQRKLTGLNLVRTTAAVLIPFKVIETTTVCIHTYMKKGDILANMQQQMQQQNPNAQIPVDGMQTFETFMEIGFLFGLAFAVVWGIALISFYFFVYLHTGKPEVRSHFN